MAYYQASGGIYVMVMRRITRVVDALVEVIDTVRWALRERRKWHPPPDEEEDEVEERQEGNPYL